MARIQETYQAIGTFDGRFTQTDRQVDGQTLQAEGSISYRKPGRMRWNYEPPHEQLVVTDGEFVWLYDPLLDNVTVQELEAVTAGTPLAFLLGVGDLTEDFACRAFTQPPPGDGLVYLELVPKTEIPTLAYLQIGAEPGTAALRSIRIVDTQGNLREVRLDNLRLGVTFPDDHFRFAITEDMEVIRD